MRIRELAVGDYRYVHERPCPDYVADLIVYVLDREDAR